MQKERRQLSIEIIRCDGFVSMPATAQALYLHLVMSCDDEGFTSQLRMCMFLAHANDKDVEILIKRRFILQITNDGEPTVTVIKHWRKNNWINGKRIIKSEFTERSLIYVKSNGNYTLDSKEGMPLTDSKPSDDTQSDCQVYDECMTGDCQPNDEVNDNPLTSSKKKKKQKEKPTQSNLTESNQKTKPDRTRYKQFALLEILVDSGYISWDEVEDGWDDELNYFVSCYGYTDTKIKLKYFLTCTCHTQIIGEDKLGKPIFGKRYVDEKQIANKLCYFDEALTHSFQKMNETDEGGSDDDLFYLKTYYNILSV